jgi:hypothetical protein
MTPLIGITLLSVAGIIVAFKAIELVENRKPDKELVEINEILDGTD